MQVKPIHNYLKRLRRERGFTQKQVAQILGLRSSSMISRWENGVCMPDTLNAMKLSALYRSTVDVLYGRLRETVSDEILKRERTILGNDGRHNGQTQKEL